MKLQGATAPRPLTHDLLVNILGELDVEVVRVTVTELRENTFHASITIAQNGTEVEIDSRSSDAIAVAVRAQAPIFAADDVIEESAIEMEGDEVNEEEIVDEFKRFLDKVSAEDFAEAEVEEDAERGRARRRLSELVSARARASSARAARRRTRAGRRRSAARRSPRRALDHRLLAVGIDERDPVLVLVALQLGDELEPAVDRSRISRSSSVISLAEPCDFVVGVAHA